MKVLLQWSFLLFSCSLCSYPELTPQQYEETTQAWIEKYIVHPLTGDCLLSGPDLQLLANLAYFSYQRSISTLTAQEIALQAFQASWQGWQNIAQTRLNPSLNTPYKICLKKHTQLFTDFITAQAEHRNIGLQYALIAEYIVNEDALHSRAAVRAVKELRSRAREYVAKSFLDAKKVLGDLFDIAQNYLTHKDLPLEQFLDEEETIMSRFDLWQTIWACIPAGTLKALIDAENLNAQACKETWHILHSMSQVNKQLWEAIECARASYYGAHYNALYTLLETHYPDKLSIIINEEGILYSPHMHTLPDLRKTL